MAEDFTTLQIDCSKWPQASRTTPIQGKEWSFTIQAMAPRIFLRSHRILGRYRGHYMAMFSLALRKLPSIKELPFFRIAVPRPTPIVCKEAGGSLSREPYI